MLAPPAEVRGQSREKYISKLEKRVSSIGGPQALSGPKDPTDFDGLKKGAADELSRINMLSSRELRPEESSRNAGNISLLSADSLRQKKDEDYDQEAGDEEGDEDEEEGEEDEDDTEVVDREYILKLVDDDNDSDEHDGSDEGSDADDDDHEDLETRTVRASAASSAASCEDCSVM